MTLAQARAVADAVLYEGYLLYPYRASSAKNQSRWQFGVLGPPGAVENGCGEDPALASTFLLKRAGGSADTALTVHLRFLQLQQRRAQEVRAGDVEDVAELVVGARRWLSWDEAVEREATIGPWSLDHLIAGHREKIAVPGGVDVEPVRDEGGGEVGRLVRSRHQLHADLHVRADVVAEDLVRVSIRAENVTAGGADGSEDPCEAADDDWAIDKESAIAASFIGAHLLLEVTAGEFVSMTDPPSEAAGAAAGCEQHRCWPVLAGPDGDNSLLLVSPIILYDHPEVAPQSAGALFDSTEIDEILTLRVMTMTEQEKEAARATDPRAAEIIDRCDALSPEQMQQMHGIMRDPHALERAVTESVDELPPLLPVAGHADAAASDQPTDIDLTGSFGFNGEVPWWDPAVDGSVAPETDEVFISGVAVAAGSIVRVHPSRRSDAQDLFFADQVARVTAVHSDVDGQTHVAVVLLDDPAADMHEWYGRYLYFAPEELEPLSGPVPPSVQPASPRAEQRNHSHQQNRQESRP